jgi:hypothetical protein
MVSANMTTNRVELRIASTVQGEVFFIEFELESLFDFEDSNSTVIWFYLVTKGKYIN